MQPTIDNVRSIVEKSGSIRQAERDLRSLGVQTSERSLRRLLAKVGDDGYDVEPLPPSIDVEELIAARSARFDTKKKHTEAAKVRTVYLRNNQTIGVGFQGDGHLDDDGTDLREFFQHAALFDGSRKGLYLGFMGDLFNNWVGRLTALFDKQAITGAETQALIKHYAENHRFLFYVLGNHDMWNGKEDILQYTFRATCNIVTAHEQRVKLVFPNGREVLIHARHKFPGNSMYATQFGQMKYATLDGQADIYVGGDKHVSGYSNGVHAGTHKMWSALQVASYKKYDEYPVELGLPAKDLYNCPVAIIDPKASDINLIRWEFDPFEGAERLKWEQSR
ncbi:MULTISPECIES: hypothetical protein [unclassified Beijerinckia]|uniref:hypothetical protein n=1 Tax=unclassified Beijerinckia TaxID=2638183 RepID=UPI00089D2707|nr:MULTISPECIES: hypothetical protein [unclassified Beijerinckia]MDH7796440.1 hypothetical protein [Beijerinckia sp. GAS462]SEC45213.1 hypothetical protein SAMN05443249_2722 [Beijerinckia sp. 28-YEA-48]